mmetsp:Transcript_8963/g.13285  ORF Transcript_8963/g.13285 Transcript_8963/m.13285 type:complete len:461 (+) Transcript_8963:109-1491(+)
MEVYYTADKITLAVLFLLTALITLVVGIYSLCAGHRIFSFPQISFFMCFIWMAIRAMFMLLPTIPHNDYLTCSLFFTLYVPHVLEFAIFTLLLIFFASTFSGQIAWNQHVTLFPCCSKCFKFSRSREQITLISQSAQSAEFEEMLQSRRMDGNTQRRWYQLKQKYIYILVFIVSNLIWLLIVFGISSCSCYSLFNNNFGEWLLKINFSLYSRVMIALIFCFMMFILSLYGFRLISRIRNRDIPVNLKLSGITVNSVMSVIVANSLIFVCRVIIDIISLFPEQTHVDLDFTVLRKTVVGQLFIITAYLLWEIIPVLTIVGFYFRIEPMNTGKFRKRSIVSLSNKSLKSETPSVIEDRYQEHIEEPEENDIFMSHTMDQPQRRNSISSSLGSNQGGVFTQSYIFGKSLSKNTPNIWDNQGRYDSEEDTIPQVSNPTREDHEETLQSPIQVRRRKAYYKQDSP